MTGLAAALELYEIYKGSRQQKEEPAEPKLEPDADESVQGYFDEDSEWHYVIQNQEWDTLTEMFQHYDFQKYKPPDPGSGKPKRKLRVVRAAEWIKDMVTTTPPQKIQVYHHCWD